MISGQIKSYLLKHKRSSPPREEAWKFIGEYDIKIKIKFSNTERCYEGERYADL